MVPAYSRYHLNFYLYLYLIVLCYLPDSSYFYHRQQNSIVKMSTFHIHRDSKTGQIWPCSRIVAETGLPRYKGKDGPVLSVALHCLTGKLILRQAANLALGSKITIGSTILLRLEICIVIVHHTYRSRHLLKSRIKKIIGAPAA